MKFLRPASRMTGTISVRLPSFFSTSTARPRLQAASSIRCGLPSISAKWLAITAMSSVATRAIAYAIRCVNETRWPACFELFAPLAQGGHGERAERGGGRDRAALVHVAGERGRSALDQGGAGGFGRRRAGAAGAGLAAAGAGAAEADAVAPLPPLALAASTSAFVMRPPRAVPCSEARSRPAGRRRDAPPATRWPRPRQVAPPSLATCDAPLSGAATRLEWPPVSRWSSRTVAGAGGHPRDHLPDADGLAVLREDLGDRPGGRGG